MHGQNLPGEATIRTLHCDRKIQTNIQKFKKYEAVHLLHYIIQRWQKGITTTFTDFIAAGFLNRDFSCTQNWDWSTFEEFISTPLCYISLQLQEHLSGGSAKVKLLDLLFLLILQNHDWSLKNIREWPLRLLNAWILSWNC
jgi:hypothetical protein